VSLVLDSGALIALERGDRRIWRLLKDERAAGRMAVSHGGIVGQVWRGTGPRQARLALALGGIDVRPVDDARGRSAGELLARTRGRDVIDAALVLLAVDGDLILTSDPDDIATLVEATHLTVEIVEV
jgi:hypothetical protein